MYFYLSLLIEENSNLVNYKYSFNLIKNINELQNMEKEKKLKKIILAKIIIDLITNYEQSDDNDEIINDYSLNNIKSSNLEIIKSNANIYKEFNLQENDIISMKIDEIYAQIIKTLIINKKLEQSEYIYNIIAQLGLESINITNTIFNELSNILDKNKDYMKEYIIREYKDLFNIKLMTFYYFLLKYILKCNVYIYKIPFLLETRNNIKKLIRDNLDKFYDSIKNIKESKEIIEYVLRAFIQYNWYLNKSKEEQIRSLKNSQFSSFQFMERQSAQGNNNIMNSNYEDSSDSRGVFSGESYKREKEENSGRSLDSYEDLKTEYEILKEKYEKDENEMAFKTLQNSEFTLNVNKENKDLINYTEIIIDGTKFNINQIKKFSSKNKIINDNYIKFLSFLNEIEKKIKNECLLDRKFTITLKFSTENVYNSNFNITCDYILKIVNEEPYNYKDENIIEKGLSEGFQYLIDEINNNADD